MSRILVLLICLFFVLPVSSVFASDVSTPKPDNYSTGLLDDPYFLGKIEHDIPDNIIDNDVTTEYKLGGTAQLISSIPFNLTGIYVNGNGLFDRTFLTLTFSNGNKISIDRRETGYIELDYKNIVSIDFTLPNGANSTRVNEVEFFGNYLKPPIEPVFNLKADATYNSVALQWNNPDGDIKNILIKQNGIEVAELGAVKSYAITGLNPETTYNFEVIAKYDDGTLSEAKTITIDTLAEPDDILPPDEISSLTASVTSFDATFAWINPPDTDFSHIRVYRDGQLIDDNHKLNTYSATGLVPNKTYVFKFVTVDVNGNNSSGYIQTIKTNPELDNIAPDEVTGIYIYNGNKSGSVRWDKSNAHDLSFYNVYVDGIKHNTSPVLSTTYVISNLDNDVSYEINVTAVDTSGNESVFSNSFFLIPEEGAMPVFKAGYELKDIADGTTNWFNTMWPILAFAVGLPLAFIVATRMKTLFFA